jgi:hypothetical protein
VRVGDPLPGTAVASDNPLPGAGPLQSTVVM